MTASVTTRAATKAAFETSVAAANGRPIVSPSQDIVMGVYFLTFMDEGDIPPVEKLRHFRNIQEALLAWDYRLDPESVAAGIYVGWERELRREISERLVPEEVRRRSLEHIAWYRHRERSPGSASSGC